MASVPPSSLENASPVETLSQNFSGACLSTPVNPLVRGRRLSMSNLSPDTPVTIFSDKENSSGLARSNQRLRLSCSRNKSRSTKRMNSAPILLTTDKENSSNNSNIRFNTLEDCDANSQDSGYSAEEPSSFRFIEPSGFAPRRASIEPSPRKGILPSSPKQLDLSPRKGILSLSPKNLDLSPKTKFPERKSFSFSANDSFDDGFLELCDFDKTTTDENVHITVPNNLSDLLTGTLRSTKPKETKMVEDKIIARPFRRSLSMIENFSSPDSSKVNIGLFAAGQNEDPLTPVSDRLPFKRPRGADVLSSKRRKSNSLKIISENLSNQTPPPRYKLQRSISDSTSLELANQLNKSYACNDLIADYSRPYALPIIHGHHEDLKSISSETLASLLSGSYNDKIQDYKIVDCRYPYEYEGGHIAGAINYFTKEQIQKVFFNANQENTSVEPTGKRRILIFHCEFSKERGPNLFRFLRKCDRSHNSYPSLQYPEVYLLHGGYKEFFTKYQCHCEPKAYLPMEDPQHQSDLRKFRFKSHSWNASTFKRLAL